MRKAYDKINHCCPICKTLMPEDYYKHHTSGECMVDEFHHDEMNKDLEKSWQMLQRRK